MDITARLLYYLLLQYVYVYRSDQCLWVHAWTCCLRIYMCVCLSVWVCVYACVLAEGGSCLKESSSDGAWKPCSAAVLLMHRQLHHWAYNTLLCSASPNPHSPLISLSPCISLALSLHCYLTRAPLCSASPPMNISSYLAKSRFIWVYLFLHLQSGFGIVPLFLFTGIFNPSLHMPLSCWISFSLFSFFIFIFIFAIFSSFLWLSIPVFFLLANQLPPHSLFIHHPLNDDWLIESWALWVNEWVTACRPDWVTALLITQSSPLLLSCSVRGRGQWVMGSRQRGV